MIEPKPFSYFPIKSIHCLNSLHHTISTPPHTMPKVQPPTPRTASCRKNVSNIQHNISSFFLDGVREDEEEEEYTEAEAADMEDGGLCRFDSGYEEPHPHQPAVYELSKNAYGLAMCTIDNRRKQAASRRKLAQSAAEEQCCAGRRRTGASAIFHELVNPKCSAHTH